MNSTAIADLGRESDWVGLPVAVAGLGIAGFACADALHQLGASVHVVDSSDGEEQSTKAEILRALGVHVTLGKEAKLDESVALLVVSPGLQPTSPLIEQAMRSGVVVWGELELAWRLRPATSEAPWLCVTGTNGKTTTTLMLDSMLKAGGLQSVAAGNIGHSLVDVVMHIDYEVAAVEVGAPQLPFVSSMSPTAAVCLNVADDHIDHFGSASAYRAAKGRIYERCQVAAVYDATELETRVLVEQADVLQGCRAIGITNGIPEVGMMGVVDGILVDRAFIDDRQHSAQELASLADIKPFAPHNVSNALAASALARCIGVSAVAVREGLHNFQPAPHRINLVRRLGDIRFVDDSKATNAHAAERSLQAYESVVWIAGGLAKGQDFDDLVRRVSGRLRAVVLMGQDHQVLAGALKRHARDVPVITVEQTDTGAMSEVVRAAHRLAEPGDVVLLAPGCASWDMFRDYADRGEAFTTAVNELGPG